MKNTCVFCGSSSPLNKNFTMAANLLGEVLANKQISLIYGGGSCGLMGDISDAALFHGGEVVGVMLEIWAKEIGHKGISKMHIVGDVFERKRKYIELSDSYIAMPGGGGTMHELFGVITLKQIGVISSPIGVLNIDNYYDDVINFIKRAVKNGFIKEEDFKNLIVDNDVKSLVERMEKGFKS